MNDYVALTVGIACAGIGGELFVRSAVGLGHWTRISPGIIGATFAAFGHRALNYQFLLMLG
jgi:cation:H+ antiporter